MSTRPNTSGWLNWIEAPTSAARAPEERHAPQIAWAKIHLIADFLSLNSERIIEQTLVGGIGLSAIRTD